MTGNPERRLDCWKDIADYLRKDVRTVIRWEQMNGLPVHRVPGSKRPAVYAFTQEIDAWLKNGRDQPGSTPQSHAPGAGFEAEAHEPEPKGDNGGQIVGAVREPPLPVPNLRSLRWTWFALAGAGVLLVVAAVARLLTSPLPPPRILAQHRLTHVGSVWSPEMVSDGLSVYFEGASDRGVTLASVPTRGGESLPFPVSSQMSPMDISSDRQDLLAGGPGAYPYSALWVQPLRGGQRRRIGDLQVSSAAWSRDDLQIAYARDGDIYLAKADGSGSRKLASLNGSVSWLRWSPDGKRLRFTVTSQPNAMHLITDEIWEISVGGGNPLLLPYDATAPNPCRGSWTPDGRYFVFQSPCDQKSGTDIWAAREEGGVLSRRASSPVRLTSGPLTHYSSPLPSLDGRQLFVVGEEEHSELSTWERDRKEFVPYLRGISALWVTFSRDGRSVAYVKYPEGTLWRASVDLTSEAAPYATEPKQLTFDPMEVIGLSWSPDSKQIAFRASQSGKPFKIYLVSAQGGEPKELLPERQEEEGIPTWSQDGTRIAFGDVAPSLNAATGNELIHIYNLTTHELSDLPGSRGLWTSRWSPDGRYIAALAMRGERQLKLFDFQSRKWRDLPARDVAGDLTWSRDSRYVYYDRANIGPNSGVFRLRVPDGAPERVADFSRTPVLVAAWSGLALDDSPLILRDIGTREIYALDVEWP